MKRPGAVLSVVLACVAGAWAEPLKIIGFETGSGLTFEGATPGNYFTLEFASSLNGPWTNWGSVCEQPVTDAVMHVAAPVYYRIKQTDSSAFPPYAPATGIEGWRLANGTITGNKIVAGTISGSALAEGAVGTVNLAPEVADAFVLRAGDTMTGTLTVQGDLVGQRLKVGTGHTLNGAWATIAGGRNNTASGSDATVSGGYHNQASGFGAVVAGGGRDGGGSSDGNRASGNASVISGGSSNTASRWYATVSGGFAGTASGDHATVGGGALNTASGPGAFIGGGGWDGANRGGNTAAGGASVIGGGLCNNVGANYATIGGGASNDVSYDSICSTVAGGSGNDIGWIAHYSTIGGGRENDIYASASYGIVAGGFDNNIGVSSICSTIAGGFDNNIFSDSCNGAIGGGEGNSLRKDHATVSGGGWNRALNSFATVPGGRDNYADGVFSFAAGRRAKAGHGGAFVWGDSTDEDVSSTASNQFLIRATGGVGINTTDTRGAALTVGGTVKATAFTGDGAGLTGLDGASIVAGTISAAQLGGDFTMKPWPGIPNPGPAANESFGCSVAALGSDRFMVGARRDHAGQGDAYQFHSDGTLNGGCVYPSPSAGDLFGWSVAALGSDKFIVGAPGDEVGGAYAGSVFVFGSNGTFRNRIPNPAPGNNDGFGSSVAALGSDQIVVGADMDDAGAADAGSVYVFSSSGTLLATIPNPAPSAADYFGCSVAALGNDKIVVGAAGRADSVYVFSSSGTLLVTIPNPAHASQDFFGSSVAALGSDRIVVAAKGDDAGATDAGSVYVFSSSGTLLTTIPNPMPDSGDSFGSSVAVLGSDRIVIGAVGDDTGATDAGSVYVFSSDGTLLAASASPNAGEQFGGSLAALGADKIVVGAAGNDTGATDAGRVYVYGVGQQVPGLVASGVADASIVNANIRDGAAIADTKLATIATAGKVADSALSANVALLSGSQTFSGQKGFAQNIVADAGGANGGSLSPGIVFGSAAPGGTGEGLSSKRTSGGNQYGLDFYAGNNVRMAIANSGKVGIGTSGPAVLLDVSGSQTISSGTANGLVNIGTTAGPHLTLDRNMIQEKNGTANDALYLNYWGGDVVLNYYGGNVGIGASANASYKLYVNGPAYAVGGWSSSDARFKQEVQAITGAVDKVRQLQGVTYRWRREQYPDRGFPEGRQLGFLAQDVEKVVPEAVSTDADGYKAVAHEQLTAVLTEAVKAQQQQIEELQRRLQAREQELGALRKQDAVILEELNALRTELRALITTAATGKNR